MHIEAARDYKGQLREFVRAQAVPETVAIGVCVLGAQTYGLAVRYSAQSEFSDAVIAHGREIAGDECDIREIGVVRAFQWEPTELQQRVRPLRPGLSVAHSAVTAGTIGAFVTSGDATYVLSNNHVLADSDRGAPGDAILQPGPADGGTAADQIGTLERAVALNPDQPNLVDAAIATLDADIEFTPEHPAGQLTGVVAPGDDVAVEKVGRTTGITAGAISAIEMDAISVEYPVGVIEFDDQIEVTGSAQAFSSGGDSGSLVYRPETLEAVGLLFAGSETGGPNGTGLTYCNPVQTVLDELGVQLVMA